MHRDATLPLRPCAPGALLRLRRRVLKNPSACSSLAVETTVFAPALRLCFVSAGSGCNVRSTSFRVASQFQPRTSSRLFYTSQLDGMNTVIQQAFGNQAVML